MSTPDRSAAQIPSSTWPPPEGCTTIVVPRSTTVLAAAYATRIAAPAALVFNTVRDTSTYPAWNTFVPSVDITAHPDAAATSTTSQEPSNAAIMQVGTAMTFNVVMNPAKPNSINATHLLVSDISTPAAQSSYVPQPTLNTDTTFTPDLSRIHRISWRDGKSWMSHALQVERFHEVIAVSQDECEVRTWENQGSALAYAVRFLYAATIKERFKDWCEGLKRYCEEKARL